jgi:hypothetical protein
MTEFARTVECSGRGPVAQGGRRRDCPVHVWGFAASAVQHRFAIVAIRLLFDKCEPSSIFPTPRGRTDLSHNSATTVCFRPREIRMSAQASAPRQELDED